MAISLQKGQKIDLTKSNPGLSKVVLGLGWDAPQKKGLFGGGFNYDLDASVILLGENNKKIQDEKSIFFNNLKSKDRSIEHKGDNLTGKGDGDDEQIVVELSQVSSKIHRLVFVVNIYQAKIRNQHFGEVQNAFIRIFNPLNRDEELVRFDLTENYSGSTAMIMGELYRHEGQWKFNAIGQGTKDGSLSELESKFN